MCPGLFNAAYKNVLRVRWPIYIWAKKILHNKEQSVFMIISTSRLEIRKGYLTFCERVISSTGTPVVKKNMFYAYKKHHQRKKGTRKVEMCLLCAV